MLLPEKFFFILPVYEKSTLVETSYSHHNVSTGAVESENFLLFNMGYGIFFLVGTKGFNSGSKKKSCIFAEKKRNVVKFYCSSFLKILSDDLNNFTRSLNMSLAPIMGRFKCVEI